jgi:hypothetical protein
VPLVATGAPGTPTWLIYPSDIGSIEATSPDGSYALYTAPTTIAAPTSVTVAAYGIDTTSTAANPGAGIGVATLEVGSAVGAGTWEAVNLTSLATTGSGAAPSAAASTPTRFLWQQAPQVVYRGQDGDVYLLTETGGVWAWTDLTLSGSGQQASGQPVGYGWEHDKAGSSLHVIYHGVDGHLHELFSYDGASWMDTDLSEGASSDLFPAGDPAVAVWDDDPGGASEHVLYRGQDNHVHELYSFESGGTWESQDLTWLTQDGATPVGNPAAFVWIQDPASSPPSTSLHVAYRDGGNGIHEYQREGQTWTVSDLTSLTNSSSAPAADDPVGVAWNSQPGGSTIHWYYRGTDGYIRELWRGDGDWSFNDLSTTKTGQVEPASGDLTAYVWDTDPQFGSSIHVTFRGQDDDIHDLWFREWGWTTDDLTKIASA